MKKVTAAFLATLVTTSGVGYASNASIAVQALANEIDRDVQEGTVAYCAAVNAPMQKALQKLSTARAAKVGWDGHSAPAPTDRSYYQAREVLEYLSAMRLYPDSVSPSVEGGIGMVYRNGNRSAYIECTDDDNPVFACWMGDERLIREFAPDQLHLLAKEVGGLLA